MLKLGKTTRKHIQYYERRLFKEFCNVEFKISSDVEDNYKLYEKIIYFNNERLFKKKGIRSSNTGSKDEFDSLTGCGKTLIFYLTVDSEIVAGCYIWKTENGLDYYMNSIGSNIQYDKYNVGQVCLFKTISWCIEQSADEELSSHFHFLWSMNDYKKRFGGELNLLHSYYFYKNKNWLYHRDRFSIYFKNKISKFTIRDEKVKITLRRIKNSVSK